MVRSILLICLFAACGNHREATHRDAAPLGEDPSRRLTETECSTAVDHAIALLADDPLADDMQRRREHHVAECVETGTLRDYRCLMASKDLAALGQCPMPGSK